MIIINLIIDKSRVCYKITIKFDKTYRILNYTKIKPRSRPPQKKNPIFYAPRFFSGQNRKEKCANYASKYGICCAFVGLHNKLFKILGTYIERVIQYFR